MQHEGEVQICTHPFHSVGELKAGDKVLLEAEIVTDEEKPFPYNGKAWVRINGAGGLFHVPLSSLRRR